MNVNFGLIPQLGYRVKGKRNKNAEISKRALEKLAELDLGIREPGGSVGLCHNAALPLPLGAQWFSAVLREVAAELH